jgi:Concanavalin A-like lectin/glucanases superfamily
MAITTFTVTRDNTSFLNNPLTVDLIVGGTATFGVDYTVSGAATFTTTTASVVIPAGALSAAIVVTPVPDLIFEPDETVILSIVPTVGASQVGINASATGTILNDDAAPPDPLFANVALLMPLNTANGLIDLKAGRVVTNSGTTSSTAILDPFGINNGVRSLTGTSFFTVTRDTALELPGDFAFEFFLYPTANTPPNTSWGILHSRLSISPQPFQLACSNTGVISYYDGAEYLTPSNAIVLNQWNYVSLNRSGSTLKLHTNGVQRFSQTDTIPLNFPGNLIFGQIINAGYGGITGYVSNLRITRAYRDGSIVPTAPFPTN